MKCIYCKKAISFFKRQNADTGFIPTKTTANRPTKQALTDSNPNNTHLPLFLSNSN